MIEQIKNYRIPILLILFLATLHFLSKDINNPYQKPITGDAEGYYAYLPAIFIYQDLDYSFTKEIELKHYIQGRSKSFVKDVDGEKVNKTFPGVALLYFPFFIIAHGIALLFGHEADGYSFIYQLCFDIGFWVYFFLALVYASKTLVKLNIEKNIANWSLSIVVLGTNTIFYSVYDISVTHIHNLFLITAAIYYLLKFKDDNKYKWVLISIVLLAIAGITRPTNIIALLLILVIIPNPSFYKSLLSRLISGKNAIKTILLSTGVFFIPLILWKLQTGHWIVYSYGEEGFNFAHPHFFEFIISYTKGWITYSPIVLLILIPGFILLYKINKIQFSLGILFYLIAIYLFSSWWCWYYGAGMGQRVMIDFSILLMFLLSLTLKFIWDKKYFKYTFLTVCTLLVFFNFAQAYQIKNGIITMGAATKVEYWDNFLNFEKRARVYPFDHWELRESRDILTKSEQHIWDGPVDESTEIPEIKVSAMDNYSAIFGFENYESYEGSKLIFSFEAMALTPIESTRLIIKLDAVNPGNEFTFYLDQFEKEKEWVLMEFMIETTYQVSGELKAFFWNGKSNELMIFRNIRLQHYFSSEYY